MFLEYKKHMKEAINEAKKAYKQNQVPVGAILTCKNKIIARAYNTNNNIINHAEIEVLNKYNCIYYKKNKKNIAIYVTLEPCPMCLAAIIKSGISMLIYGANDSKFGAVESYMKINEFPPRNKKIIIVGGILKKECSYLIKTFFKNLRKTKKKR